MTDFYAELNLDKNKGTEEINTDLSRLESTWKRREITMPEKATTMLALIIEARKVFANDVSRAAYDRELVNSQEKPDTPDPNAERKKQFEKWRSDALSYYDSRQYDLAKTAIDQALSYYDTSSDNDAFFSLVADVYWRNHIYPTALDFINKAIVINPQYAMHYNIKAGIYRDQAYDQKRKTGYFNDGDFKQLIKTLNQAVNIAHRNNDRRSESVAYGLLAFYYYFDPFPDKVKAEEYAKKSLDMGDEWGNASKVLDDIKKKHQQEVNAIREEAQRKENARKERIYTEAKRMAESKELSGIKIAISKFETIPDYKDSAQQIENLITKIQKIVDEVEEEKKQAKVKKRKSEIKAATLIAIPVVAIIVGLFIQAGAFGFLNELPFMGDVLWIPFLLAFLIAAAHII